MPRSESPPRYSARERERSRSPDRAARSSRDYSESRRPRDDRHDTDSRRPRDDGRREGDRRGKDREGGGAGDDRRRSDKDRSRSRSPAARRRSRSRSRDREHHRSSRRRSPSRSGPESSSGSDSEDSRERRHRKKKSTKSKDKDGRDSKGRTKEERHKIREEKKAKKERKLRKKKGLAVVEWGKYGLIAENDIYSKDQEFRAWLVGEKMVNPETLSKAKEKEIFKTFMEEYNTGTLPHEKYYNIEKYEVRMNSLRNGESVVVSEGYDPNKDLEDARAVHRRSGVQTETYLDRNKLEQLRQVQSERIQMERMNRIGMKASASMGVRMDMKLD